ncbi:MAG: agmatine deiminase family protein [Bdellovibrionota bacterium]
MPAEWEKHTATWTCWPCDEEMWFGKLGQVRKEFCDLVKTISNFEKVHLLLRDKEALQSAQHYFGNTTQIVFHEIPLNDVWFRDNGPIFIKNDNKVEFVKWEFNSWGEKFKWDLDNEAPYSVAKYLNMNFVKTNIVMEGGSIDVNGAGIALTTKQCLLSQKRNPNLNQTDLEKYLENYLGIKKCLWLENGLEGDHTDGHIDTIVRFVNENTIVYSLTEDKTDKNYDTMRANFELLKTFKDLKGESFHLIPLVLPKNKMEIEGARLPCTYANFYIGNGFVVVPQYDDPHDKIALEILTPLFPNRTVIGLNSKYIICGGGSFHCVTQQQPSP